MTGTWYPPSLGTGGVLIEAQLFTNPPFKMTEHDPTGRSAEGAQVIKPQPLSPAAQAVLDAVVPTCGIKSGIAVALRAAVNQVISNVPPPCADFDEHAKGFLAAHVKYRRELLAIAAELEGSA